MQLSFVVETLLGLLFVKSGLGNVPDGSQHGNTQQGLVNMDGQVLGLESRYQYIEGLELRLSAAEEELRRQKVAVYQLKSENHDLQERLNVTEQHIEQLKQEHDASRVAFSASLADSDEVYQGPSTDKTLVFKRVFTNKGDGYSPLTGIFTAPVNGLYFFSFSTYSYNTHVMGAILLKNGVRQVSTYDNVSTDVSDGSGNAVVLHLVAGDKVHMELWDDGRVFDNLNGHTTFSGFLLFHV